MKYDSIVFVTSEEIKNRGSILDYFISNTSHLLVYSYYQGYSKEKSYLERFVEGKRDYKKEFPALSLNINILKTLSYRIYLEYILWKHARRGSFVVVEKSYFLVFNSFISFLKSLRFVFWIGDYFPENTGSMKIYNFLVDYYNEKLKYVLYVSPRVKKVYYERNNKRGMEGKYRALITLGTRKKNTKLKKNPKTLSIGFIAVLRKMGGLDLFFDYLLKKKESRITLEIVGGGYYLNYYKDLAKKMGLSGKVKFYGFVKDPSKIIRKWDVGIALYENREDNLSLYGEPVKIKDYIDYGLPIITTSATYIADEIEKMRAGVIIEENIESLDKAVESIKKDYLLYLEGIDKMRKKYEYKKWYDKHFKFMLRGQ
jgi:glycosyltransferase involved in cell wall biosynthesis